MSSGVKAAEAERESTQALWYRADAVTVMIKKL
jgi:hypothetical protein